MSLFYQTVTSDGSKGTRESSHGGDFTIDLYDELYFPGEWEVALVEMSYVGQIFPNIPQEYAEVVISNSEKNTYQTDFVVHFHQIDDEWEMRFFINDIRDWRFDKSIKIQRKHYTWYDFKI